MDATDSPRQELRVAKLVVVDYEKIRQRDEVESAKLYTACVDWGFFYLDLSSSPSQPFLKTVEKLFGVSNQYFSKSFAEKLKDTREDMDVFNICGYKPIGLDQGNVKDKKDGCEGLRVSTSLLRDPICNATMFQPDGIKEHWPAVTDFMHESQSIVSTMLSILSDAMGLADEHRLEMEHRASSPSTSAVVLQCYPLHNLPPNTSQGHFTHTDAGTLSVLFTSNWGLQVHPPGQDHWAYVAPRPNCAVVNVGDSLRFLSQFRLRSCLHRVVPCHERWTSGPRYSVIYFLRPNDDAEFVDSEGARWTGRGWLNRKFGNYRLTHEEQGQTAMATGGKGFFGLWGT